MADPPEFLFRYVRINEYLYQFLTLNLLYFSRFDEFNDPFDCGFVPDFEPADPERVRDYVDLLRGDRNYEALAKRFDEEGFEKVTQETYRKTFLALKDEVRVLCLSAKGNSTLMFSHYADKHHGVCLKLRSSKIPLLDNLKAVDYPPTYPTVSLFGGGQQDYNQKVRLHYYTKAKDWAYEEEWRLVIRDKGVERLSFPPEMIASIIFGFKTSAADKAAIINLMQTTHPATTFKEVVGMGKDFDLSVRELGASNDSTKE
jgi:hypothetical protein